MTSQRFWLCFISLVFFLYQPALGRCIDVFSTEPPNSRYNLIRFGFMPLEGRLVGGEVSSQIWVTALMGKNESGNRRWSFHISTKGLVLYLNTPLFESLIKDANELERTTLQARRLLNFVCSRFQSETSQRDVFSTEFLSALRNEDEGRVEENMTFWVAFDGTNQVLAT